MPNSTMSPGTTTQSMLRVCGKVVSYKKLPSPLRHPLAQAGLLPALCNQCVTHTCASLTCTAAYWTDLWLLLASIGN